MAGIFGILGGDQPQGGILGGGPQWANTVGLIGAALKDAANSYQGRDSNSVAQFQQFQRQNQLRQAYAQAANATDPAIRQQAYAQIAGAGGDPSGLQKMQAQNALPQLLQNLQPSMGFNDNPVGVTPAVNAAGPGVDAARAAALQTNAGPAMSMQPSTFSGALQRTGSPELSAEMAPQLLASMIKAPDGTPHEGINPATGKPGQYLIQNGQPRWLDVGVQAKAPTTRNIRLGTQEVTQEFDPTTGVWKEVGRGAAFKPEKAAEPVITGAAPGTIGAPTIDVTATGYSRDLVPHAGGLTQSAIDQAALALATTGRFPTGMGIGSAGAGGERKNAIQNRAGELNAGGNLPANASKLKALTASLTQQTNYANATERSVSNAENGFRQVVTAFKGKVNNSSIPIVNAMTNAGKYQLSPGDISAFRAGLTEVANEYSNVFSRGGIVTDAVRAQAKQIADGNLSIDDLSKVFSELQAQGNIVINGSHGQVQKIQGQLNNILQGNSVPDAPSTGAPPPPGGPVKFTFTPQAANYLKSNPNLRAQFDQKYGAGAAASVLGR